MASIKQSVTEKKDGSAVVVYGKQTLAVSAEQAASLKAAGFDLTVVLQWLAKFGPILAQLLLALLSRKNPADPTKLKFSLFDLADPKAVLKELLELYREQLKGKALELIGELIDELLKKLID